MRIDTSISGEIWLVSRFDFLECSKLKEQGTESVSNRILHIVSINHATNDASVALLPTLFPIILSIFKISLFELGVLVAAMYLTNVICQPITGLYSERFEARMLLPLGIGIIVVSMVFLVFAFNFPTLLFSAVMLRVGSSFFHPVGISTISRAYSGDRLDKTMGFQSAFGNFGIFVVFLIAAPIYYAFGWSTPFLIFALLDSAVIIITIFGLSGTSTLQSKSRGRRKIYVSLPVFFLATTFISGATNAMVVNYGNILLEQNGFSVPQADLLIAVWIGFSFLGAFYTGALTKRFTRVRLIVGAYLLAAFSVLFFSLLSGSALISAFALAINGFSIAVTYPAIYSELSSYLGPSSEKKGPAYGMIFSSQIIGSAVMGFFAGYISGMFGLVFAFEVATALLIGAAVVSSLRRPKMI